MLYNYKFLNAFQAGMVYSVTAPGLVQSTYLLPSKDHGSVAEGLEAKNTRTADFKFVQTFDPPQDVTSKTRCYSNT